ncbi:MAG: LPS export ABC transporter periplasmic protein LptC [Porticoccaceae bacterium]
MKTLLLVVAAVAFTWVSLVLWRSPPEFFFLDKKTRSEDLPTADSYMRNTRTLKFAEDGSRAYILAAETGLYYEEDDRFELTTPHLTARRSPLGNEPWQVTAESARSTRQGSQILLNGDIHAWQDTPAGRNEMFTRDVLFTPRDNIATTASPVKLVHPQSVTTGTGMEADFDAETYRLLADVRSLYHAR